MIYTSTGFVIGFGVSLVVGQLACCRRCYLEEAAVTSSIVMVKVIGSP